MRFDSVLTMVCPLFQYVSKLGMPATWNFTDVWGLDPDVLAFVQGPVKSVLLLYPISDKVRLEEKLKDVAQCCMAVVIKNHFRNYIKLICMYHYW